jgi:hypothetical protein
LPLREKQAEDGLTAVHEKLVNAQMDVPSYLAQQWRSDVAAGVEGNGCAPSIMVSILAVGATLPDQLESESFKDTYNLSWFEYRNVSHLQASTKF